MAGNTMTSYYAKRIIGDATAAGATSALLQTGTSVATDTWILNQTNRGSSNIYGLKYVYDSTSSAEDKIEFRGAGALAVQINLKTGATNITGATALDSTLSVGGATTLSTTLEVTGATTLSSTLGVTGASTLTGNTTVGGTFGVSGATTLSSTLGVSGATTLSSTLGVTGATTLSSTLKVTGGTTLSSTLSVSGKVTMSSNAGVNNNEFALTVTGNVTANKVYNAVWNDYAEYRECEELAPGTCVKENNNGCLTQSNTRLIPGASIITDTFGYIQGKTDKAKTPIAVCGRVLAYPYLPREQYQAGQAVCSAPNGTVDIMTREEIRDYPDAIIGIVSEIPDYEIWGSGKVKVDGRIWIKIK